jgi:membrane-bound acyltransferase YfiQ involved in biofilm formation
MQPLSRDARGSAGQTRPYMFVNTARFWSMVAVVAVHCLSVFGMLGDPMVNVHVQLTVLVKFGTIGFFLISGFLLGDKLKTCRASDYLLRRLKRVFVPWAIWYVMLAVYIVVVAHHDSHTAFHLDFAELTIIGQGMFDALFLSPLWFVPNLLLGICVLLVFRRWLYSVWLGSGLFLITAFYAVNIYPKWVPSLHPEALLGFVFYLWLGSFASHHRERFLAWVERVPAIAILGFVPLFGWMSWKESEVLMRLHSQDAANTLRMSNQILSVLVVLLLLKVKRRSWPAFVDVRREMFGVYLVHSVVLFALLRGIRFSLRGAHESWMLRNEVGMCLVWVTTTVVVFGLCLGITKALAAWPATAWLVGAEVPKVRPVVFAAAETESWTEAGAQGIEA